MSDMGYIFFGSGDFAAGLLLALAEEHILPELVISTPDRPRGRGLRILPGPVSQACKRLGLRLLQPEKVNSPDFLASLPVPDFILVSDFGRILRQGLLELPRIAPLNLHPSLLPLWRGAAPLERSIMAGGPYGITLFVMDQGMDTGPLVLQKEITLWPWPTKGELVALCLANAPGLINAGFEGLLDGSLKPLPQEGEAVHAPKIEKAELWPDWNRPADVVACHINALSPKPCARIMFRGKLLKLLHALPDTEISGEPGRVIVDNGMAVACSNGGARITRLQPEGKNPMTAEEFARGLRK